MGHSLEPPALPRATKAARRGEPAGEHVGLQSPEGILPRFSLRGEGSLARVTAQDPNSHVPDGGGGPSTSGPRVQQRLGSHQTGVSLGTPYSHGGAGFQGEVCRQGDVFLSGGIRGSDEEPVAPRPCTGQPEGASGDVGVVPEDLSRRPDEAPVAASGSSSHPHIAIQTPSSRGDAAPHERGGEVPPPQPGDVQGHRLTSQSQFVVCVICGAFASRGAKRLGKTCTGPLSPRGNPRDEKRAKRRDRILANRHPDTNLPLG